MSDVTQADERSPDGGPFSFLWPHFEARVFAAVDATPQYVIVHHGDKGCLRNASGQ